VPFGSEPWLVAHSCCDFRFTVRSESSRRSSRCVLRVSLCERHHGDSYRTAGQRILPAWVGPRCLGLFVRRSLVCHTTRAKVPVELSLGLALQSAVTAHDACTTGQLNGLERIVRPCAGAAD
jgi:hypothetical protein